MKKETKLKIANVVLVLIQWAGIKKTLTNKLKIHIQERQWFIGFVLRRGSPAYDFLKNGGSNLKIFRTTKNNIFVFSTPTADKPAAGVHANTGFQWVCELLFPADWIACNKLKWAKRLWFIVSISSSSFFVSVQVILWGPVVWGRAMKGGGQRLMGIVASESPRMWMSTRT